MLCPFASDYVTNPHGAPSHLFSNHRWFTSSRPILFSNLCLCQLLLVI